MLTSIKNYINSLVSSPKPIAQKDNRSIIKIGGSELLKSLKRVEEYQKVFSTYRNENELRRIIIEQQRQIKDLLDKLNIEFEDRCPLCGEIGSDHDFYCLLNIIDRTLFDFKLIDEKLDWKITVNPPPSER